MSIFDIWRKKDDTPPDKGSGNIMQWREYYMVHDTKIDGSVTTPDDMYGVYRRKSGRVCADSTSVELNTGRTGTDYGSGADSTRVERGRDKTTPDDIVYKRH